jgi:replicative DNA helicase
MSLCSNIPARVIKSGTSDSDQFEEIVKTASALERSPIFITEDACNSNLKNLVENIKKVHADQAVKLIVIDHLGLIRRESKDIGRANEVGEITRTLKLLAKELNLPILCLAQLNRQADTPEIPQLSHLRESGSIEQDADVVIFVHRRDYYDSSDRPGELDIIIAKNRDGEGNRTISHTYSKESWLIKEKAYIAIQVSESVRNIMNLFPDSELDIDDEAFRQALKPNPKKSNNYKR